MIVVSDTSPLTNLAAIGQFDLLRQLYDQVYIADAVWDELNAKGKHWPGRAEVASARWIQRCHAQDQNLVAALQRDLDRGEAESIAIAIEIKADMVLMDEREGRHLAQRFGLRVIGVIGVLLEAKAKGAIAKLHPHLDALRETAGVYLSESLYQAALKMANES